ITTKGFASFKVEDKSLLLVHPSKHYHTDSETIYFSNKLANEFQKNQRNIIALSQHPIHSDSLWYVNPQFITHEVSSRMGEHDLSLPPQQKYQFTIIGNYHSACLGRAMANLISNSFDNWNILEISLPTRGIFTGFQFKNGKLFPSVDQESWADSSIDGLNLYRATYQIDHTQWEAFTRESLEKSIFKKNVILKLDLSNTKFEVYRNSKKIFSIENKDRYKKIKKVIRIYYLDTNNL